MSREQSVGDFEALFEKASVPRIELAPFAVDSIRLIRTKDGANGRAKAIVDHLASVHGSRVVEVDVDSTDGPNPSFLGDLAVAKESLIVVGCPPPARREALDRWIRGTRRPVLIVPEGDGDPAGTFNEILLALAGSLRHLDHLEVPFSLAPSGTRIHIKHAVSPGEFDDVREALRLTEGVSEELEREILDNLLLQARRHLRGIVLGDDERHQVTVDVVSADLAVSLEAAMTGAAWTLVVLGAHRKGRAGAEGPAVELLDEIGSTPVLVL